MKLMYEVEQCIPGYPPNYIYIETDDDIDIELWNGATGGFTHITTIDTNMGLEPDLIIRRPSNE
jgi:hypothetical protein